ncbi:nucleotide exchange factor GrpE [Hoylesella nanceiensis]|jgi:grpE|uniref:nucleotide exchange factor GrpE n=1 Tax=Hoylesella nanceiensis TaxID=425941 RepID=UPI001CB02D6B|nr:nucleotide exchange factor GrpE [Hoylesella nanceiensis]MBF1427873.1 nucleotide exchange factor GrpE [Hoylesella nanceiensis]MBF1439862.1 nucleotide exchange factor GrpE [Hoylesella nanceiensis]
MSNKGQNTEKETLDKESLNAEETTNTADSQNECNETTSQGESVETVETLKAELEALKDKYLRTVAEFDNYKKRTLKEKTELILNGSEKTVTTFLPILDDMERAIANAGKAKDITAVEEGWELIYNKFIKQLDSIGVKKIETNDADFDVDYHEAVAMVPGMGDDKKGKVIDCVQTGYTLNDKVIRHAKVAVGQ